MYNITALRRIHDTKCPWHLNYSFDQLAKFLSMPRNGIKTDKHCTIPAWSPARFDGKGLKNHNVIDISCMVFDIDDGLLFEEHKVYHPFQYIAYSSPSHYTTHHKWRLVIPFEDPIPVQYWKWVWEAMVRDFQKKTNSLLNGGNIDKACKDPRRFYFLGKENKYFEYHINDKGYNYWINLEEIIKKKEEEERQRREFMEKQRAKLREFERKPQRNRDEYQELKMNLNLNPQYRRTLAERIDATITSDSNPRAIGWECPNCNRNDCTFFYIYPGANRLGAFCNHKNSCGLSLSLFELGRTKGVF